MSNLSDLPVPTMADVPRVWTLPDYCEFLIHGVTIQGKPFRPSDWSERLCGVMACFRPRGVAPSRDDLIGYSPFVQPVSVAGLKCVLVDPALRQVEVMALDFVMNFARDNALKVTAARGYMCQG
jgi:hypothetical protein